jgi:hypothetical protein
MVSPTTGLEGDETAATGVAAPEILISFSWKSTLPKVTESLGCSRPLLTRLPLMQVPLELPRSLTCTPSTPTVSSACRRDIVGS